MSEAGSSNAFDCFYIPEIVIVTIIILAMLSILTLLISITAVYKMVKYHKTTQKYPKSIYYTQLIFYIICAIVSICRVPDIIACNYFPTRSIFHSLTLFIISWGYIYHWIAFVSLFYYRLKHVFYDTIYQISKCYNCISIFIICLLSIIFPLLIITSSIIFGSDSAVALSVLLVFISIIFSQTLAFTLIYKLYKLNKNNTSKNTDDRIISTMTKYTLLTLLSMTASIVYIIIVTSGINKSFHSSIKYLVVLTSNQLDLFIDTISVSLTLKIYDKYYKILCIKCDTKCKQCCLLLTGSSRIERKLANQMSNIPSTTSVDNTGTNTITVTP